MIERLIKQGAKLQCQALTALPKSRNLNELLLLTLSKYNRIIH